MIDNLVTSINAGLTKVVGEVINKSLYAGKETSEVKKAEIQRDLEDTKKVLPVPVISGAKGKIIDTRYWEGLPLVYNSKGEVVDSRYGENIDISA